MSRSKPTRTPTTHLKVFTRPSPSSVSYSLTFTPQSVTLTVPTGSTWTSGPHWHELHTEYLEIHSGSALITLGPSTKIYHASSTRIKIPPFTPHEWRRAEEAGDDLVVTTRFSPVDSSKEIFFRSINSFLMEEAPTHLYDAPGIFNYPLFKSMLPILEKFTVPLQLFTIFRAFDNWPMLGGWGPSGWFGLGWVLSHSVCLFATVFGWFLGIRSVYEDYISPELVEEWRDGKKTK